MVIMGHGSMRAGAGAAAESHIFFFRQREKGETKGEGLPACAFETAKPAPSDIVFFSINTSSQSFSNCTTPW